MLARGDWRNHHTTAIRALAVGAVAFVYTFRVVAHLTTEYANAGVRHRLRVRAVHVDLRLHVVYKTLMDTRAQGETLRLFDQCRGALHEVNGPHDWTSAPRRQRAVTADPAAYRDSSAPLDRRAVSPARPNDRVSVRSRTSVQRHAGRRPPTEGLLRAAGAVCATCAALQRAARWSGMRNAPTHTGDSVCRRGALHNRDTGAPHAIALLLPDEGTPEIRCSKYRQFVRKHIDLLVRGASRETIGSDGAADCGGVQR
jgi:hypothetical protein